MAAGSPREPGSIPEPKSSVPETGKASATTPRRRPRKKSFTVGPNYISSAALGKQGSVASNFSKMNVTLEGVIEGTSLLLHGIPALIVHTIGHVPENPIKAVGFVAVLIAGAMGIGMITPGKEDFCFHCIIVLAIIAVGLIVICLKNPGSNDRLREMQDERIKAVGVTPFRY